MILIEHIMGVSIVLWCVGLIGVLMNRHNVLLMLMSLELMFLAINTGLVGVDQWIGNAISGQLMVVFTLTIAAAEAAIALAIFILIYRHLHGVDARSLETLKG